MDMTAEIQGLKEAMTKLDTVDNGIRAGMRRALFRIGGLAKRTAVDYAPISPSTSMLKKFRAALRRGGENANVLYVAGRKGRSGQAVKLTAFYEHRLPMLLSKDPRNATRPTPGGLMRSITFRSDDRVAEIFVPANSPAGSYAFKIHDEKGSAWKERGPGTQAKGAQADDKFILRAINDNARNFTAMVEDEINKALERAK